MCPIKVDSYVIELTMKTSCYCVSDLLFFTLYHEHSIKLLWLPQNSFLNCLKVFMLIFVSPKSFHVGIDESFIHGVGHSPGSLKFADQFIINWTSMVVNQLNLFVGAIVSKTVIDNNVKPIWNQTTLVKIGFIDCTEW